MGYFALLGIGGVVVVILLVAFISGRRRPAGRARPGNDVTPRAPAADEPTPGASEMASGGEVRAAQQRTPPA